MALKNRGQTSESNPGVGGSYSEGSLCILGARSGAQSTRRGSSPVQLVIGPRSRSRRLSLEAGQAQGMDAHSKRVPFQCATAKLRPGVCHTSSKGMPRALFANTHGPAPPRNKRYPNGFRNAGTARRGQGTNEGPRMWNEMDG